MDQFRITWIMALAYLVALPCGVFGEQQKIFEPDRQFFFQSCRRLQLYGQDASGQAFALGHKALSDKMQPTINQFFDQWQVNGTDDKRMLAYILATAFRESKYTFEPIREVPSCENEQCREQQIATLQRSRTKLGKEPPPNYARQMPNGNRYYGRGFSQLTFALNYKRIGRMLGMGDSLLDEPDLALELELAVKILVLGMRDGWFTGKKLADYFSLHPQREDWVGARAIVNPKSPHKAITAKLGEEFNSCLRPQ